MTLTLDLLPARQGDALLLEYGTPGRRHRVLIDGGPSSTATRTAITTALGADGSSPPLLDLLVVTHIDADHITGVLNLLERDELPARAGDVWFNGWDHLPSDLLGAKQGERLSELINRRRLPWNAAFDGGAVMVPDSGPLPVRELPGGLRLTLLSPTRAALTALRPVWKAEVLAAGLVPGVAARTSGSEQPDRLGDEPLDPETLASAPFVADPSEANGSSIAFLAEYEGRSVLLTGDAHDSVLADGLRRLAAERGTATVRVDALKVPHHGSRFNVSSDVLDLIECERFLFSTSGAIHRHPDRVAIARIVARGGNHLLAFNYRTSFTEPWGSRRLRRLFDYKTVFPEVDGHLRITV